MSSSDPASLERPLPCPGCAHGQVRGAGRVACTAKRCDVEVIRFPVIAELVPDAAAGRCARHPTKDGVAACVRCGGFVCEVCATRTGDQVLCPACFDLLHGRGELATTKTTRFRMDQLALALSVVSCACYGVGLPFALWLGIRGLRRRAREPWISKSLCWSAIVIAGTQVLVGVVSLAVFLLSKGSD